MLLRFEWLDRLLPSAQFWKLDSEKECENIREYPRRGCATGQGTGEQLSGKQLNLMQFIEELQVS